MKNLTPKVLLILSIVLFHSQAHAICTASYTHSAPGFTVIFTNTSTTSGGLPSSVYYLWDFGDGTTSTLKNPIKTFTSAGVKNIQLTVYDSSINCSASNTDTIIVTAVSSNYCYASFTTSASALSIIFTNQSKVFPNLNPTNFYWDFGDGTTSTLQHPVKIYSTPGPKVIKLSIYDSLTGCSNSWTADSLYLQSAGSKCKVAFFTHKNDGLRATFDNNSLNTDGSVSGLKYFWNFGDSTYSTAQFPVKLFGRPGLKNIRLTIKDSAQSCYASAMYGTYFSGPAADCRANFTANPQGVSIRFYNTSLTQSGNTSKVRYMWDLGDSTTTTLQTPPLKIYSSTGNKIVKLTMYDSLTGCSSAFIDTIFAINYCKAAFTPTITGLTVACKNQSLNSDGTSLKLSYLWDFGDSTTSTSISPTKSYTTSGTRTIRLSISDTSSSCSAAVSKTYTFTTPGSGAICSPHFTKTVSGLNVSFHNGSLNSKGYPTGLQYLWNFGDGTTSSLKNPTKMFATNGAQIVSLAIYDTSSKCRATKVDTIIVAAASPLCQAGFSILPDSSAPFQFFIANTSIYMPNSTFNWNFGDGTTSSLKNPTHSFANFGMYYVCLTVADSSCTSTFCDTLGMDSNGVLLKIGRFSFKTIDQTTLSKTTGIKENTAQDSSRITLFPNPATHVLHVHLSKIERTTLIIEVSDMTGRVVQSRTLNGQTGDQDELMDIRELNPSIYFVRVTTADNQYTMKFLKQ